MASTTPNIGLTLPVGTERVSRQTINENNTKIDQKIGPVGDTDLQTQINSLNSKIRTISSGSLHDITTPGIYWFTSGVTDKPEPGAGMYVMQAYSPIYHVGTYTVADNCHQYSVSFVNNTWKIENIALTSDFVGMFTRKYRTYTNITIPSGEYIKVDSYSEMDVNTNQYLISMNIRGWNGNINGVTLGKSSGGTDFYLIGGANKTISSITVEYIFSRY